jgi:hypothetical protein
MSGQLNLLRIEIDGHFNGSKIVPKPWVAQITGTDPKWGLVRKFLDPMNDWTDARRAWSGNLYGRVAQFALRDGNLYEVFRAKGKSSRRYMAREFLLVSGGKRKAIDPEEALAHVDGGKPCCVVSLPEDREGTSWVSEITGLGTPRRLGFVVVGEARKYRCPDGIYEVVKRGVRRLISVSELVASEVSEREAMALLCQ